MKGGPKSDLHGGFAMWRKAIVLALLVGAGCAGGKASVPRDDMILQPSEEFFAKPPPGTASEDPVKAAR